MYPIPAPHPLHTRARPRRPAARPPYGRVRGRVQPQAAQQVAVRRRAAAEHRPAARLVHAGEEGHLLIQLGSLL